MEDREFARSRIAAQHGNILGVHQPRDLQLEIILIGPEPGHFAIRIGAVQHGQSRVLGLIDGVLNRFQTHARSGPAGVIGAIARRIYVGVGGAGEFVDDDAVVAGKPRLFGNFRIGNDADAGDNEIGRYAACIGGHGFHLLLAVEGLRLGTEHDAHTVIAMLLFIEIG